jgi:hypothetical protein
VWIELRWQGEISFSAGGVPGVRTLEAFAATRLFQSKAFGSKRA